MHRETALKCWVAVRQRGRSKGVALYIKRLVKKFDSDKVF